MSSEVTVETPTTTEPQPAAEQNETRESETPVRQKRKYTYNAEARAKAMKKREDALREKILKEQEEQRLAAENADTSTDVVQPQNEAGSEQEEDGEFEYFDPEDVYEKLHSMTAKYQELEQTLQGLNSKHGELDDRFQRAGLAHRSALNFV